MSSQSSAPYGKVPRSLWISPWFRALEAAEQVVYLYLLTGPHSHMSGISQLSLATMADDLNMSREIVRAAINGPLATRVEYDETTREVFVVDGGRVQVCEELQPGDKRRKPLSRHLASIHSARLLERFHDTYGSRWNLTLDAPADGASDGAYGAPAEAKSKSRSKKQEHDQQQPHEQRAKHEQEGAQGENGQPAGQSTEDDNDRNVDLIDAIAVAKDIAQPGAAEQRWIDWIYEHGEKGMQLARGLRHAVDTGKTSWPRGELFKTPAVFDHPKCTGLRGQAMSAYRRLKNSETERTGGFTRAEYDGRDG